MRARAIEGSIRRGPHINAAMAITTGTMAKAILRSNWFLRTEASISRSISVSIPPFSREKSNESWRSLQQSRQISLLAEDHLFQTFPNFRSHLV
jgi:hypothetical protein